MIKPSYCTIILIIWLHTVFTFFLLVLYTRFVIIVFYFEAPTSSGLCRVAESGGKSIKFWGWAGPLLAPAVATPLIKLTSPLLTHSALKCVKILSMNSLFFFLKLHTCSLAHSWGPVVVMSLNPACRCGIEREHWETSPHQLVNVKAASWCQTPTREWRKMKHFDGLVF